ncbi:MAG: type II toxin-antitoxin system VapB family antitoxin [Pseudomonadales bacterium]|jgi:Arc/MetJ family transcription regulator|nr:type II toxin-antitoxin system VapB family antitoxin [Pseudomonadales bacterium]
MRTTLNLDENLLEKAQRITELREVTTLIHLALKTLVERESARRLARLGGSEPHATDIPRRRGDSA